MTQDKGLRTEIHEITSLLARRVVAEVSKKGFSGELVALCNMEADKAIISKVKAHYEPLIAHWREKCFNDTMSAKKSGWDDAEKFYKEKIKQAFKEGVDKTHKACDETYGEMLKAERERIEGLFKEVTNVTDRDKENIG